MKILVTGASGYVGREFIKLIFQNAHQVIIASRFRYFNDHEWVPFDLVSQTELDLPNDIDTVVHLAADTSAQGQESDEISSSSHLINAANKIGAKFIFVSSQAASKNAPTSYGRIKWSIEQKVLAKGGLVVRLGQVYGGVESGLFGTLVNVVRHAPVLPAFIPSPMIQPIHVNDCAEGLLRLVEQNSSVSNVYCLASPQSVSFKAFLQQISNYRVRCYRVFIPVPVVFIKLCHKVLGEGRSEKLGLYRLNSLFALPYMETAHDLDALNLKLRPLTYGMHCSGNGHRRELIQEAVTMLTYVLKAKPKLGLVRRYVRVIDELRSGSVLGLPAWSFRWPVGLVFFDFQSALPENEEFAWRIDAVTVIAESSVEGSARFLGEVQQQTPIIALFYITKAVCLEALFRVVSLLMPSFLTRFSKKRH